MCWNIRMHIIYTNKDELPSFMHVCGYQLEKMAWRKTACIAATKARGTWCRGQDVYIQITSQWIYSVHWLNILTFNTEWCRPSVISSDFFCKHSCQVSLYMKCKLHFMMTMSTDFTVCTCPILISIKTDTSKGCHIN